MIFVLYISECLWKQRYCAQDKELLRNFISAQFEREGRGIGLKKVNWVLLMLVLVGFVIGRFIGTYFEGTFLNYGQAFGLSQPVVLDLGFFILTFGLTIQITIASVIGVVIALVIYRFIR